MFISRGAGRAAAPRSRVSGAQWKFRHHKMAAAAGVQFASHQFDMLREHGMMAVPFSTPEFVAKVKDHPSLLAWYLVDEPEGAGNHTPAALKQAYAHLKEKDPNHPIGVCNFLFEALEKFKEGCDFTMTDVYPILAQRDGIIGNVGVFVEEARRVHGPNWPHWCVGIPVRRVARLALQDATLAKPCVKRVPGDARRSRFGVRAVASP